MPSFSATARASSMSSGLQHEPHCAVREAASSGALDANRYETYLRILASLAEGR